MVTTMALVCRYLHEMLKAVYPMYDIVIWSANSLQWIEVKLRQLQVSNNPDYKITCFLDCRCMVPVRTERQGKLLLKPFSRLHSQDAIISEGISS